MATDKRSTTYRLSEEARALIKRLAAHHGMSETDVVEFAVRLWAKYGAPPMQPELPLDLPPAPEPTPPPKPKRKPRKGT